ncbi:hypothetical protein KI387_026794, partial [Taxus chinensis]
VHQSLRHEQTAKNRNQGIRTYQTGTQQIYHPFHPEVAYSSLFISKCSKHGSDGT